MDPVFNIACALILSYVMMSAAWHKFADRGAFAESLANYQLLPRVLHSPLAIAIPLAETFTGLALVIPQVRLAAAAAAGALLALYTGAIAINLLRGRRQIDCGCGGGGQKQHLSNWLLLRNGVLIAFAAVATMDAGARPLDWFDWSNALFAAAAGCLLYQTVNVLLANRDLLANLRHDHG